MRSYRNTAGFTLLEVLLASAILAFCVAAISQAIALGHGQTYEAIHGRRAVVLAEALLEEVLSLPFADPEGASVMGPEAGESSRSSYDNCDDFDGFADGGDDGPVRDAGGVDYGDLYQVFTRAVAASDTPISVPGFGGDIPGLTVTVTVTDDRGLSWSITRFIPEPAS